MLNFHFYAVCWQPRDTTCINACEVVLDNSDEGNGTHNGHPQHPQSQVQPAGCRLRGKLCSLIGRQASNVFFTEAEI